MSLADEISKDRGQPATVRVGQVTSTNPLTVLVQQTPFIGVGVLEGYIPVAGDVAVLLGQSAVSADGSSWLMLGRVVPSDSVLVSAVAAASDVDVATVSTTSATYVPLTGGFNVGAVFVAPASGRVVVHWRAQTFADVGTTGRMSFRIGQGAVVGAGTLVQAASDSYAIQTFSNTSSPEFGASTMVTVPPGVVCNIEAQHRRATGAGNTFYANRQVVVQPVP